MRIKFLKSNYTDTETFNFNAKVNQMLTDISDGQTEGHFANSIHNLKLLCNPAKNTYN